MAVFVLTAGFDVAIAGGAARLVRSDGVEIDLPTHRWHRAAAGEDRWLLDRCRGSVIDLGCGPGRLVEALVAMGLRALGVDSSAVAQHACRRRGVPMLCRDLFDRLPDEGRWDHVLLADGNIGIGGDPLRLLRRAVRLLRPGGTVLVETGERPDALWRGTARVLSASGPGVAVPWAEAGARALVGLAADVGLHPTATYSGRRTFVELVLKDR
jgi:SAM-dependent methyltransferase